MRLFVVSRHAQSVLNLARVVSGDPARPADLTERGIEEARLLGLQVSHIRFDACIHTRFERTRRTAEIALEGRGVPFATEPLLDDIAVGELDGTSLDEYRAWKVRRGRDEPFPGGESLNDAARRYAQAYRHLLAGGHRAVLLVCHEIPLRYALNGAAGSDDLDAPVNDVANATPFLFDAAALTRAVERIEQLAG